MLDFAYGELQLKPDDFWRLTWGEYYRIVRGYHRRVELERHKTAAMFVQIRNAPHFTKPGKKAYELDDFMPRKSQADDLTVEQRQEMAEDAIKRSKRFEKGVVKEVLK